MVSQDGWQLFTQLALPGLPLVPWARHAGYRTASAFRLLAHLNVAMLAPVIAIEAAFVVPTRQLGVVEEIRERPARGQAAFLKGRIYANSLRSLQVALVRVHKALPLL